MGYSRPMPLFRASALRTYLFSLGYVAALFAVMVLDARL